MYSTISTSGDWMGGKQFIHKAGAYTVLISPREHGLSILIEDGNDNRYGRPNGISSAIRAEHMPAFVNWLNDNVGQYMPRFVVKSERVDYAGNTNIVRNTLTLAVAVHYYEENWPGEEREQTDPSIDGIHAKLNSMRVGDMFAVGRSNRKDVFVCIADETAPTQDA